MRPALEPGDRLLVAPVRRLRPGDVVALGDPERPGALVVKRVARLTDDAVVVLGDRSELSVDSRHYGPVARRSVLGVAVYRYAPGHRAGRIERGSLGG
jgi:nickel-type superoxide dismutase maturation protease